MAAPRLRLVQPPRRPDEPLSGTTTAFQQWLFPHDSPSLLIVFNTLNASEREFLFILENSHPRVVIDFRSTPRFDFGSLNRRQVFERLSVSGTKYIDMHELMPNIESAEWDLTSARVAANSIFAVGRQLTGPILCLLEGTEIQLRRLFDLASLLPQEADLGWDILLLPERDTSFQYATDMEIAVAPSGRNTIFISHANPEDNDFVSWLYSRLKRSGYEVWADINSLGAGTSTWDEIEKQIRFRAAKVVVVLSKAGQSKQGVLDEVNLAVSVERSRKVDDFVVPIKLDSLAYIDVRANLSRKNIVDFSKGWSAALAELLDDFAKSKVKRESRDATTDNFRAELGEYRASDIGLTAQEEIVDSNWLPIQKLPTRLFFLEMPAKLTKEVIALFPVHLPLFWHQNFIGSFFEGIESTWPSGISRMQRVITVDTEQLLQEGLSGLVQISAGEARKRVSGLLHKAWRQFAIDIGLKEIEMSSRRRAYAFPAGFADSDRADFLEDGVKRTRKLVGRSEKRNVQWHWSIELTPRLSGLNRYILRSHVLFSSADGKFIQDSAKQHSLRRGFCRSWWNDRWRTLMLASLSWMAKGESSLSFPLGGKECVTVASRPMELRSPISLQDLEAQSSDENQLEDIADDGALDGFEDDNLVAELVESEDFSEPLT